MYLDPSFPQSLDDAAARVADAHDRIHQEVSNAKERHDQARQARFDEMRAAEKLREEMDRAAKELSGAAG